MTRLLIAILCILPTAAFAKQTSLAIPGQNWHISFDLPGIKKLEESNHPEQYKYFGGTDRVVVSLYVESPGCAGGTTHEAFYECFWPKASRNPLIVKESVQQICTKKYCKVVYDVEAPLEGRLVKQRNINFLIAYGGKWTDMHVSVIEPTKDDLQSLGKLENSLTYGNAK